MLNVVCHECGLSFLAKPSALSKGNSKFCSRECWRNNISGKRYGDKNPNWRGEHHEFVGAKGYIYIRSPGHHRALHDHVKRSTIIAEKKIGRLLFIGEVVHHINGRKDDDRPENLEIISQSEHAKKHIKSNNQREAMRLGKIGKPLSDKHKEHIRAGLLRYQKNVGV